MMQPKVEQTDTPRKSREPLRIELAHVGAAPVVHVHEPAPLLVTDRNCAAAAGLTLRAWRKVARSMSESGFSTTTTCDGVSALRADVEEWMRTRAPRPANETSTPAAMSDGDMLKKLRGAK